MKVVIRKGGKLLLRKLIRKGSNFFIKNEVVKLENEVVIIEIVFGMVHGQAYEGFQKIPHIRIPITRNWNISEMLKFHIFFPNFL